MCKIQFYMATTKNISIDLLEENIGQLEGLPSNPRWIRYSRFEALKKSIQDAPEMLQLRELLVYPLNGEKYIIIGGNMRFRACKELGFKELPCKVIPKHIPVAKLREYVIKDNEAFGQNEWTKLTNDWAAEELVGWGVELDAFATPSDVDIDKLFEEAAEEKEAKINANIVIELPKSALNKRGEICDIIKEALAEYNVKVK